MIICVYAMVSPAPVRLRLAGIGGERLRVITVDRLSAIVGELKRVPRPTIRNLRRYAAVIEAIASKVPAILPARFATTVTDRDELAFILRSRGAALRQRLRAVGGRAQMTIRLVGSDPGDVTLRGQTPVTRRSGVRPRNKATQGTQYLQQRIAIAARARAVAGFDPIRNAVGRFVKDERVEKRGDVVTINHLVPRTAASRYLTAVERAAEEGAIRLSVSGPWAPYAFADNW
jgi:gas vesicle protein GvpL/GvpF